MKNNQYPLYLSLVLAAAAAAARFWMTAAARSESGLPVFHHPSTYLLLAILALTAAAAIAFFRILPEKASAAQLCYSRTGIRLGTLGGVLVVLGSTAGFYSDLIMGPDILSAVVLLSGAAAGFGLILAAHLRGARQLQHPAGTILALIGLILLLVVRFKDWSTDPIILDYFFPFLSLLSVLLAVHTSAGILFSRPQPKRAFFFTMLAIVLCGASVGDSLYSFSISWLLEFSGFLLWLLPVLSGLTVPAASVQEKSSE